MMNNKPKGKQQQQQVSSSSSSSKPAAAASQTKKGGKARQPNQSSSASADNNKTSPNPYHNKPKNNNAVPEENRNTTSGLKNDPNLSNLSASLKRMNYSNKKTSKGPTSHQNNHSSSNKRNHHYSSPSSGGTSRIKSRDEDHKNDPMGHKKNQFGKMRLTEFLNIDQSNIASTSAGISSVINIPITATATATSTSSTTMTQCAKCSTQAGYTNYSMIDPMIFTGKQFQKKNNKYGKGSNSNNNNNSYNQRNEPRNVVMNSTFVPIEQPKVPILSSSNIAAVIADTDRFTIFEKTGKLRTSYPIMQVSL